LTDPNTVFYVLETDPLIYFKIVKMNTEARTIQQLSRDRLEAIGQYQEGFQTEEAWVAGEQAVKVKAFARDDPDTRLLDYYFAHGNTRYGVMFSVKPKDRWEDYHSTFQEMVNVMHFI
jgi:hypothetical protein